MSDRHTFFLSEICKKNRIYFTLVQHGTLFKIDNFKLCEVNEFAYCFDFSLPFLKYYLKNIEGINIKFIPNESKSIEVVEYEKGNDNIAFACMPTNVALNFKVINALSEILNKNFNLIIYPHPREDFDSYLKAYNKNEKIIVSRAKYSNVKLVVSRVSTIGVDFANIGLPVIYVNFEQSETDYLATGKYAVVYEIETLNKFMLENYSPYHQLVKDAIVYSIANGINRGALLLVFPLILFFYGTEVFGRFSLIWGVSQLLGPIISLSGTTAIIREGTVCRETGAFWTKYFYALTMFSSLVFILLGSIFIYGSQFEWVLVSLLLAFPNALILLKLSQLRILEGTSKYFFLSMQKLIILVFSVLIAGFLDSSFYVVCFCLIVGTGILWLKVNEFPMSDILLTPFKAVEHDKSKILMYCFFVIPHSISTWVMSASDKLVIDYYMDDLNLGIYSISYTLGMILIVINSGLAIALPKYFYKDITTFSAIKMRNKLVFIYTLLALLVSFIVASLISLDRQYIGFIIEKPSI